MTSSSLILLSRSLPCSLLMLQQGKIIDFTQANPWWEKIRDTDSNTWDAHKQLFMPLFHNLRSQFISECPLGVFHSKVSLRPPILLPSDISPIQNPTTPIYKQQKELKVVQLIKSMGLEDFSRKFGVVSHRHSNHPNLVFLTYDVWIPRGGFSDGAIKECNGIVLDEFANWNVICYPYNKVRTLPLSYNHIILFAPHTLPILSSISIDGYFSIALTYSFSSLSIYLFF